MIDVLISAATLSAIYGLVAIGISLTWSTLGMLNLAHGAAFVAAGYGAWFCGEYISTEPLIVIAFTLLVGGLTGVIVYLLAYLPLEGRPNFANRSLIATLSLSLFATQLYLSVFGPRVKPVPKVFERGRIEVLGVELRIDSLGIIICAVLLVAAVLIILQRSRIGLQMRAIMQNAEGAALVGINRRLTALAVLVVSGVMVGLASVLLGQTFFVSPEAGVQPLVKGLIASLLGGLGSVPGAIAAAVLIGLAEAVTIDYVGSQYVIMVQLALVALMLIFRPRGIAGIVETVRE